MAYVIADSAILRGKVAIGDNSVVEDLVILGTSDSGELVIGANALIRSRSTLYSNSRIGDNFRCGHDILIRENTHIGDDVLVGTGSVIDGDCRIGNRVAIQTGVYVTRYTTIGDDVFLGPHSVTTNDKEMRYGAELRGPVLEDGARIGANAVILPGVRIGRSAVVGAGAVVTRDVPEDDVVAGNPARSLRRGT